MQKTLSYLIPLGALLIVVILAYRWVKNTPPQGAITPAAESAEGIEITDVTGNETSPLGVVDSTVVKLNPTTQTEPVSGEVRYSETTPEAVRFTVFANLPELTIGQVYQLWIEGEKGRKKAMRLEVGKGGYFAEGNLTADFNQVKFIVSKEVKDDDQLEEVLLDGVVTIKK
jgi:hypothetical protein